MKETYKIMVITAAIGFSIAIFAAVFITDFDAIMNLALLYAYFPIAFMFIVIRDGWIKKQPTAMREASFITSPVWLIFIGLLIEDTTLAFDFVCKGSLFAITASVLIFEYRVGKLAAKEEAENAARQVNPSHKAAVPAPEAMATALTDGDSAADITVEEPTVFCGKCGVQALSNSFFCPKCGARIISSNSSDDIIAGERMAFCRKCGAKAPPGSSFCRKCGARIIG